MKPALFEYRRACSVDEVISHLADHGDEAKVLAGGQSLMPLLNFRLARPGFLIDVNRVPGLGGLRDGAGLRMGSMVRHQAVERSEVVHEIVPVLAAAMRYVGHVAIRTRGTVGGSIAHADPAAELPMVLLALDGEVDVQSVRGTRTIAASDLFRGFLTTAIEPDELLTEVRFPASPAGSGWSIQEFSRRSGDFAVVGVTATVRLATDGTVDEARLAFSGVDSAPVRARATEARLGGEQPSLALWEEAARDAASALEPSSDLHGSAAYRHHLAAVLAGRALTEAHARAQEA